MKKKPTSKKITTNDSADPEASITRSSRGEPDILNEPLTTEERKAVWDKLNERDIKTGLVLTGGIDSLYMLEHFTRTYPDREFQPIVIHSGEGSSGVTSTVKQQLETAKVKGDVKSFTIKDKDDIKRVIKWARENNITPILFATNAEENEANIPGKNFADFQALNDVDPLVDFNDPLNGTAKSDMIKKLVEWGVDISNTTEPKFSNDKYGDKLQEIRAEAFRIANIGRIKNRKGEVVDPIIDPYAPKVPESEPSSIVEELKPEVVEEAERKEEAAIEGDDIIGNG